MRQRALQLATWTGTAVLIVLAARAVAYQVTPTPAARLLEHRAGGPALPVLVVTALAIGAALSVAICWLAALGVRERALLERRAAPSFGLGRTLAVALGLAVTTSLAGGLFEAYIHWRAGLGWHGLHCLIGPVHQNLIPIEGALSLVGAAVLAAAEHIFTWMQRTFASLGGLPPGSPTCTLVRGPTEVELPHLASRVTVGGPRAPPALS